MKARRRMTCGVCGATFQAKPPGPRLCGARCRKRASRAGQDATSHMRPNLRHPPPVPHQEPWTLPRRCRWCGKPLDPYSAGEPVNPECFAYAGQMRRTAPLAQLGTIS
jgi:hypothetical protein